MAFKATFHVDGKEFTVQSCHYGLHQNIDAQGQPQSTVRGGTISVTIEGTDDNTIFNWMTDPHSFRSGKITFYKRDQNSKLKDLEFDGAACIDYAESYDANSNSPMMVSFTLTARKITMNGDEHQNEWSS